MSRLFPSTLSLKSTNENNQPNITEKAKLVSLIKTWRSKYEKVQASLQQYIDLSGKLKSDVDRLTEEKDNITRRLTTQLEKERSTNESIIKKLKEEAQNARNEPEIEARNLREKLERIKNETGPIVAYYKNRDTEMDNKVKDLENEAEHLKKLNIKQQQDIINVKTSCQKETQELIKENKELKDRFKVKIEEIRNHCASKIAELQQKVEKSIPKTSGENEFQLRNEYETKVEKLKSEFSKQAEEIRQQVTDDYEEKILKAKEENKQKLHQISIGYAKEINELNKTVELLNEKLSEAQQPPKESIPESPNKDVINMQREYEAKLESLKTEFNTQAREIQQQVTLDYEKRIKIIKDENKQKSCLITIAHKSEIKQLNKKVELLSTRMRHLQKNHKDLNETMKEATETLYQARKSVTNPFYGEVIGTDDIEPSSKRFETILTTKDLLGMLTKYMKELRELKLVLDRYDSAKSNNIIWNEEALRSEVEFHSRLMKIEHLKKLIYQKRTETALRRKPLRHVMSFKDDTVIVMLEDDIKPVHASDSETNPKQKIKRKKMPKFTPKSPKVSSRDSGRDKWLFTRETSTIQFLPTVNGRQAWLDHEVKQRS